MRTADVRRVALAVGGCGSPSAARPWMGGNKPRRAPERMEHAHEPRRSAEDVVEGGRLVDSERVARAVVLALQAIANAALTRWALAALVSAGRGNGRCSKHSLQNDSRMSARGGVRCVNMKREYRAGLRVAAHRAAPCEAACARVQGTVSPAKAPPPRDLRGALRAGRARWSKRTCGASRWPRPRAPGSARCPRRSCACASRGRRSSSASRRKECEDRTGFPRHPGNLQSAAPTAAALAQISRKGREAGPRRSPLGVSGVAPG